MSGRHRDGDHTLAPTTDQHQETDPPRQLKLSRSAAEVANKIDLATCQLFLDSLEPVALLLKKGTREIVACNKAAKEHGITLGSICYESWANRETPCPWCQAPKMWKTGETLRRQTEGEGRFWDAHWAPISDDLYLHYARDITEQKVYEGALKESEERLSLFMSQVPGVTWIKNGNGEYTFANEGMCSLANKPLDGVVGATDEDLFPPEVAARLSKNDRKVVSLGKAITVDESGIVNGDQVHYQTIKFPLPIQGESTPGVAGVGFDVTERKRAEEKLRESEERYRTLFEADSNAIFIYDPETTNIIDANEATSRMYGYDRDELIGMSCLKFSAETKESATAMDKISENGKINVPVRYHQKKDGTLLTVEISGYSIVLDGKNVMFAVSKDITERKQAEEALNRQKEELQIILDSVPAMIFYKDKDNRFIRINEALAKATQLPRDQIEGKTAFEVYPEHAEEYWQDDLEVIESGIPKLNIVEPMVVGEETMWVQTDKIPYRNSAGDIIGIIGFAQDITKRKKVEEELKIQTHELAERVKEQRGLYRLSQLIVNPDLSPDQVYQEAVELLPSAWHYPKITCGRIVISDQEYVTDNYANTAWKQSTEILVAGTPVGIIEVAYVEEMPEMFEGPFMREERNLINGMAQILGQYIERVQHESRLRESNARLIEGQLALESKNTTLNEIIEHVDREKKDAGLLIQSNIDKVVMPLVEKLKIGANSGQIDYLNLLGTNLRDVASPFIGKLEAQYARLSPREVEICKMLINGMTSKEIATALNTSVGTVFNQRKTIRKKLGIASDNINLVSFLKTI